MSWTETVAFIAMLLFLAFIIPQCTSCVHEQDTLKFECMKAGHSEADCRFPH